MLHEEKHYTRNSHLTDLFEHLFVSYGLGVGQCDLDWRRQTIKKVEIETENLLASIKDTSIILYN